MPHDPTRKLSPAEIRTYGADAKIHQITGEVVEQGSGAHPPDVQAALVHVLEIERREGRAAADKVRAKLKMALASKKED